MILIILFLVGPIVLGLHLLGASWELAAFIGLIFYPALSLTLTVAIAAIEALERRQARKRFAKRLAERDRLPSKPKR